MHLGRVITVFSSLESFKYDISCVWYNNVLNSNTNHKHTHTMLTCTYLQGHSLVTFDSPIEIKKDGSGAWLMGIKAGRSP